MSQAYVQLPADGSGKQVECDLVDGLYRQSVTAHVPDITSDAGGRLRVSQFSTLFDGKTLNVDSALQWSTAGTGTATFADNAITLSVTSGQYLVRQSKHFFPYFSGKPQVTEPTFDTFAPTAGLTKRVGYFSSSTVAPYDAALDGWYFESSDTIYLVVVNAGTEKLRVPWTDWNGYADLAGYNWDNFTVTLVDFLWLGGAVLRVFVKSPNGGFVHAHTFDYAGSAQGVFMHSPNQPVRYELRSTGGAGSFREICSQVSTEGSISENGQTMAIFNRSLVTTNAVGTIYALKGVKRIAGRRDAPIRVDSFGVGIATADTGLIMLLLNPTLSAGLTYATSGNVSEGTATNQTVINTNHVLAVYPAGSAGVSTPLSSNTLAWLGSTIAGVEDEIVLAYMPLTTNQSVAGMLNLIEY